MHTKPGFLSKIDDLKLSIKFTRRLFGTCTLYCFFFGHSSKAFQELFVHSKPPYTQMSSSKNVFCLRLSLLTSSLSCSFPPFPIAGLPLPSTHLQSLHLLTHMPVLGYLNFSPICVQVNSLFPSLLSKSNVIGGRHHASLVLEESMQRALLHPVPQQHRNTARLSLITNKEARIFQDHCSGRMDDNCARRAAAPFRSHHF